MAANLTLSGAAIAADGKTLTATISGGTGTGYALSSATGIAPHVTTAGQPGGQAWNFAVVSASVLGTTLTVNLKTPAGTSETVQLDFPGSVTLTDSGGNTPTGQTNLAVTNSSAVAVTVVAASQNPTNIEINGVTFSSPHWRGDQASAPNINDGFVEIVTDATEVAVLTHSSTTVTAAVDSGAFSTVTNGASWNAAAVTSSPLSAGKHLFRFRFSQYCTGFRLSGGTRTLYTVPTTKRTYLANSDTRCQLPTTTPVSVFGAYKDNGRGQAGAGTYDGIAATVGFSGTGVELEMTSSNSTGLAVSVDGAPEGALQPQGNATTGQTSHLVPIKQGLTPGAHTLRVKMVGAGTSTNFDFVKVLNGTRLASAASAGATSLSVDSAANISVNDWIKIGSFEKREARQVTAISGSGPYTLTIAALTNAQASGEPVTSWEAPAGSLTAWVPVDLSARRITGMGDSNTQGYNDYGQNGTPDADGTYYVLYDPRTPPVYLAGTALADEVINLGIQGQTSVNLAARTADIATYSRSGFDYFVLWIGTNDINGNITTPAEYQTNCQAIVTAALTSLRAGGKVILMAPGTPSTTSAKGLNIAACVTALQAIAAGNPSQVVFASTAYDNVGGADANGLHWHVSGQQKIAANLLPYLGGSALLIASGFFAAA